MCAWFIAIGRPPPARTSLTYMKSIDARERGWIIGNVIWELSGLA